MNEPFAKIDKLNMYIRRFEQLVLIIGIALMAVLLITAVITRYIFMFSFGWTEEIGTFLLILTGYIGSSFAARQSKHIKMNILSDLLSYKNAKILAYFTDAVGLLGFGLAAYYATQYAINVYSSGRTFDTLPWGFWIIWIPVVLGLAMTAFQYAVVLYKNIKDQEHLWIGAERTKNQEPRLMY